MRYRTSFLTEKSLMCGGVDLTKIPEARNLKKLHPDREDF